MILSKRRAGLVLFVALSTWARSDHLVGQERRGPVDVLLTFAREKARMAMPPETRPDNISRTFLKVGPGISGRDALGSLDKRHLERLGVTLVDNKLGSAPKAWADTAAGVLVLASAAQGGSYVRDDGVFVVISSVDRVDHADRPGALAIAFHYYVTFRETGRAPVICLEEWRVVMAPGGTDWKIVDTRTLGHC
jgi:hypothetical protein